MKRVDDLDLVRDEPGWCGAFTRNQVPGAIPNGTLVEKVRCDPLDAHSLGAFAIVLGSIRAPVPIRGYESVKYFYFVEWRSRPRTACGVVDYKIRAVRETVEA